MSDQKDTILVINSGSSSLKFMLFKMSTETMVVKGLVERIGTPQANLVYQRPGYDKLEQPIQADDHGQALDKVCATLCDPGVGVLKSLSEVDAVGHRVLHCGEYYSDSVAVDENVKKVIRDCFELGPLHNPANLQGILACEKALPGVMNVAVIDTAFHQTMPKYAYLYALPKKFYDEYKIRKYGFHGTSHKFVTYATAEYLGKPKDELNAVICHLGNGSSISAIKNGKVLDTSMGLTPLAGLVMGTRCGDLDPAVVLTMARKGYSIDEIDKIMNKQSGLLAINGVNSSDMRDTEAAAKAGNPDAQNALDMFAHRIAFYIGGYFTLVGGPDAIVFTGGIGENSVNSRKIICERLKALGVELDEERNQQRGKACVISSDSSKVKCIVMPTNEELMIARDTYRIFQGK
ncbi:MAG: acetate kinase [Kiritimatiellae bacterium]|nr:acetate kinase [Kiritimatiellia bacterium]